MTANNSTTPVLDPDRRHESRGYQLITAAVVCVVVAAIFAALRIYTRLVLIKKRFWEDLGIAVALACSIVLSVFNGLAVVYGSGRHFETINPAEFVSFIKVGIVITQFYSLTHFFLKLSVLLQYVRVSVLPLDKRLCHGLIAVLCAGYFIFILLRMVRCLPFAAQWNPKMPGAKCFFNPTWFMFASQAWNMVMDFVILLLPLFILRHSKAPLLQRVLIGVVLAFGGTACIISALRLQTLHPSTTSADPSWDKVPSAIYGVIEVNVGIICASVVTLRPLFHRSRHVFSKIKPCQAPASGEVPQHPVRHHRLGDTDILLMTGESTTKAASDGHHDVELGKCDPDQKSGAHFSVAKSSTSADSSETAEPAEAEVPRS